MPYGIYRLTFLPQDNSRRLVFASVSTCEDGNEKESTNHYPVKVLAGMNQVSHVLEDILDWLIPKSKLRSVKGVLPKLVFDATAYFIWQERNLSIFQKKKRSKDQVVDILVATVRLKLLSFRFKKSKNVDVLLEKWNLPMYLVRDAG
ncbi:hypothetical protein Tco_0996620 [Tanacetum coccineum]